MSDTPLEDVEEAKHLLLGAATNSRAFRLIIGGGRLPVAIYNTALFDRRMHGSHQVGIAGETCWRAVWTGMFRSLERRVTSDAPGCIALGALCISIASFVATAQSVPVQ